jgi:uncharacterized protein YjdB
LLLVASLLLAGCHFGNDTDASDGRTLVSITVLPASPELPAGGSQKLFAIGHYSDGFQANLTRVAAWTSSDSSVATVDSATGRVTAVAQGRAEISARFIVAGSTAMTVSSATLDQLVIQPADASEPAGTRNQFTALGQFSDGSTSDVTGLVTWRSSNPSLLTVTSGGDDAGLADFLAVGDVTLSADYLGRSAAVPVEITLATLVELLVAPVTATVPTGLAVAYEATGIYSDGTNSPLTDEVTWSSSATGVATIDSTGEARGVAPGNTIIRADLGGFSADASLEVTAPVTVGLAILPPAIEAPAGTRGQLRLVAYQSDGSTVEATAEATWRSSNLAVAAVVPTGDEAGFGYLLAPGTATVSASYDGLETSIPVTVTPAVLVEILLEPVDASIAAGIDLQYTATGIYSDGRSEPLQDEVSWQSSDPAVATVDLAGLAHGVAPGVATVTATFDGVSASNSLTVTNAVVTALQILPGTIEAPAGTSGQLTAIAFYSDGTTQEVTDQATWTSTDDAVLFVVPAGADAGLATALSAGSATVGATFQGVTVNVAATVTPAVLTGLVVTPPVASVASGRVQQFTAAGLYSDGTSTPLDDQVGWQSSNPAVAVIDLDGLALGVQPGTATITASFGGFSDQATLTVTPAVATRLQALPPSVAVPAGTTGQLRAAALYSDGTLTEVTAESTWNSSDETVAYVIATGPDAGRAKATGVGAATVNATFAGLSSAITVSVSKAVLTEIQVEPVDAEITRGLEQQFTATGFYSDGTSEPLDEEVAWQTSDPAVATVDLAGLAKGIGTGVATITASFGGLVGQATLTVTAPTLTTVQVTPAAVSTPVGTFEQFTAMAFYTDGTSRDVTVEATWTSSDPELVDVVPSGELAGLAMALAEGAATLIATFQGISGAATLTATPAVLVELIITPADERVAVGRSVQYTATGLYSDGSNRVLTERAGWKSSDPAVAVISPLGLAEAVGVGTATISASVDGTSDTAALEVTPAVAVSVQILGGDFDVPAGRVDQLRSVAYYTDGSSVVVTDDTTWNSSDLAVLVVGNTTATAGLAVGRAVGVATVSANFQGLTDSVQANVTAAVLVSIDVEPSPKTVPSGVNVQYQATGIYSDGTSSSLTDPASWQSSDPAVATVLQDGLVDTLAPGSATISASYAGVSGQAALTVTAATVEQLQVTPSGLTKPAGTSGQLTATAFYTDGDTEDVTDRTNWTSSEPAVATVVPSGTDAGFTELLAPGSATVTATFDGVSDSTPITVTNAVLVDISIEPANTSVASGIPVLYSATGLFSDGSSSVIDDDVTWQSSNPAVATIGPGGMALTETPGATTISATADGVTASTTLTVTNAIVLTLQIVPGEVSRPLGTVAQLQAIAQFSDLTTEDVTTSATWTSTDDGIVDVVSGGEFAGLATMVGVGSAFVSASYQGANASIKVEVTAAALIRIEVDPVNERVARGVEVQYNATGIYTDGTSQNITTEVTWRSSNTSIATIDNNGLASTLISSRLLAVGATEISATTGGLTDATQLSVTAAVATSVQITPTGLVEPAGTSGQLTATAFFSDNTSQDVTTLATWTSSNTAIVAVGASGETGGFTQLLAPGTATVSVLYQGIGDADPITVTNAVLTAIEVQPASNTVPDGTLVQYSAVGIFSDGSNTPIDADVSWASSDSTVATIGLDGVAQAVGIGTTTISASLDGVTGNATLDVTAAIVVSMQITPPALVKPAGTSGQLTATATFSDNTSQDVTNLSLWESSNFGVVEVVAAGPNAGFTELIAEGAATVTASYQGVTDDIDVETTSAVLVDIQIDPPTATRAIGLELQYNATGLFSDGTASAINDDVTWQSGDTAIATITADGVATGKAVGETTISASFADIDESVPLIITDAVATEIQVSPVSNLLTVGQADQYRADAVFSDARVEDVTDDVTWSVGDPLVANISNSGGSEGLLTTLSAGLTSVDADFDGITGSAQLDVQALAVVAVEVVPVNITIPEGLSSEWVALALLGDGSTLDVTEDADWLSVDNDIASVSDTGVVFGVAEGMTTILATYQGIQDDQDVTVSSPDAVLLGITPSWSRLSIGTQQQLIAIVAISPGLASVTASLPGPVAGGAVVEVADLTLASLVVTPASKETTVGSTVFFTAIGTYDDGTVIDLTNDVAWTVDDTAVAQVGNGADDKGVVSALGVGATTLRASIDEGGSVVQATASLTVDPSCGSGNPDFVTIEPDPATVSVGATIQLQLIADYAGCKADVTTNSGSNWSSRDPNIAAVSQRRGEVIGLELGTAEIEGKFKGATDTVDLDVITPEVYRVRITAGEIFTRSLAGGAFTLQCVMQEIVAGVLRPEVTVTGDATWTVDNPAVLLLGAVIGSDKRVTPLALGSAVVACHYGGKRYEVAITVN